MIVEVFSTMVGAAVTTAPADAPLAPAQLTGIVGIAAAIRENCILQCSHAASTKLSSQTPGILPDDPDFRKASAAALGEICNPVAGYCKAKIELGNTCMLLVRRSSGDKTTNFIPSECSQSWHSRSGVKGQLLATLEIARGTDDCSAPRGL